MKDDKGIYTWEDGSKYEGNWQEDSMNGKGTYYFPEDSDGYKLVGPFEDDAPDGDCDYYVNKDKKYKTTWSEGKCIKLTE